MSNNNDIKPRLKAVLERHQGRNSAITRRELRQILDYQNDRKLRILKDELVKEGLPVLSFTSPPAGYCLPANWQELHAGLDVLRSYIIDLCILRANLKKAGGVYLEPAGQRRLL